MRNLSLTIAVLLILAAPLSRAEDLPLDKIKLPPGFAIELLARVPNAREMALGTRGTLFVGSMEGGKVYAVTAKSAGPATVSTIASGLNSPVGVAFHNGALYVSAVSRILRFDDIESRLDNPPRPVVVVSGVDCNSTGGRGASGNTETSGPVDCAATGGVVAGRGGCRDAGARSTTGAGRLVGASCAQDNAAAATNVASAARIAKGPKRAALLGASMGNFDG